MRANTLQRWDPCGEDGPSDRRLSPGAVPGSGGAEAPPPGHPGGGHAPLRDAPLAGQLAHAAPRLTPPLALPRLDPSIPQYLHLRRLAHGLPELAEAMLQEGLLRESDWTGDLRTSIRAGFERWVGAQL